MDKLVVSIISSILILMFIISGISKIFTLGKSESNRLSKKLNVNEHLSQLIVFIGGLWEILSCIILLYGIWTSNQQLIIIGSISLVIFTIAATFMFYVFPFKYLPILSNLTTICALLLLPFICIINK